MSRQNSVPVGPSGVLLRVLGFGHRTIEDVVFAPVGFQVGVLPGPPLVRRHRGRKRVQIPPASRPGFGGGPGGTGPRSGGGCGSAARRRPVPVVPVRVLVGIPAESHRVLAGGRELRGTRGTRPDGQEDVPQEPGTGGRDGEEFAEVAHFRRILCS